MADGELIFDTKINTKGFEEGTKDVTKSFKKTANEISSSNSKITRSTNATTDAFIKRQKFMKELQAKKVNKQTTVKKEVTGISSVASVNVPKASDFTEQAQSIKWANEELKNYYKSLQLAQSEINRLKKVSESNYAQMEQSIKKMYQTEYNELKKNKANKRLGEKAIQDQADANLMVKQSYQNLLASQERIESNLKKLNKEYDDNQKRLKYIRQENQKLVDAQKKTNNTQQKSVDHMRSEEKESSKLGKAISKLSKRFATLIRYMVIRSIFRQVLAGFQDLAKYSTNFNSTMSSMQSSFYTLRNSVSVAFAPALENLAPIIVQVTDAMSNLFNLIGMYSTALFTNKKTAIQAKKVTTDYAKSLGGVSDSAEEATKALADFDEISKLEENTAISGLPTPSEMFEEVAIPSEILSNAEKIKEVYEELKPLLLTIGAIAGGLFVADEVTKLVDWLKKIGLIKDATDGLTGSMRKKNDVLGDQTTQTAKETSKVLQWGLALGGAGIAVWGLKNALEGLKESFPLGLPLGEVGSFATAFQTKFAEASEAVRVWKENVITNASAVWQYISSGQAWEDLKTNVAIGLKSAGDAVYTWGSNVVSNAYETFNALVSASYQGLVAVAENIGSFVHSTSVGFAEWGMNLVTNIGKTMKGWVDTFVSGLQVAWNNFVGFMKGIGEAIGSWWKANKDWVIPVGIVLGTVALGIATAGTSSLAQGITAGVGALAVMPALATGTVVPANNGEFGAILGDNKKEPEIVSPLSTMEQAMRNVLEEQGGVSNKAITIVLEMNRREFARAVYQANNAEMQRVGLSFRRGGATA